MPCLNNPPTPKCPGPEGSSGGFSLFSSICKVCKEAAKRAGKVVKFCEKNPGVRPPTLYSWGKKKKGGKLDWLLDQTDSDDRTRNFEAMLRAEKPDVNRRGPGLYLCNTLTGSSEYLPKVLTDECVLVQVEVGATIPCLDIHNAAAKEAFSGKTKIEITDRENRVTHDFGIAPVLIHFTDYATGHWYVLKTPAGCTISLFDGVNCGIPVIEEALTVLSRKQRHSAYRTLLRQLAPGVVGRLNPRFIPLPPEGPDKL